MDGGRGGRNKRRGRGFNQSKSPRGRGDSPGGQQSQGSPSEPSQPVVQTPSVPKPEVRASPNTATPSPKVKKMETPDIKITSESLPSGDEVQPTAPATPTPKVEIQEIPSETSTPKAESAEDSSETPTPIIEPPQSPPDTTASRVEPVEKPSETPKSSVEPEEEFQETPRQFVEITDKKVEATPDLEFLTPVSSPTDLMRDPPVEPKSSPEEETKSPIEAQVEVKTPTIPTTPTTPATPTTPVAEAKIPSRRNSPALDTSSFKSSELSDPDDALPDLESVEHLSKTPVVVTQAAVGGADNGSKKEVKRLSLEEEKIESVPPTTQSEITGKQGYLGGMAGLGGKDNANAGGDGYESDDSLLTPSRRPSTANGSGNGWMGFSRRQVLTLLVFSLADFFSAIIISLQAPFFPQEAELKGATATEFGLVFGVFELVVFLTSPIYGKYLYKLGPKHVFNIGICVAGVATILFGFLDQFEDRTAFITLCFVVRIIEALGDAAFITASFAIIAAEFPDSVATTFASLETFFGLGLIVGPTVGGALYQKGGFTLPFVVMGGLLLVVAILTFLLMPKSKPAEETGGKQSPGGILAILKVPGVALASVSIITGSISIGFLNSTLEPHIRQFNLSPVLTGLVFIINGGLYAVTAPAWGWLCDRVIQPVYAGLAGAVVVLIGFLLIGPAPFVPVDTVLWLTCVGLMVHGIGLGATLVSAFVMALRESINHGFADNIQTYGLTSALWTSLFALGSFIGPSVGGILLDEIGFRWATVFVIGVQAVLMILILGFLAKTRRGIASFGKDNLSEHAPLLGSISEDPCTSKTALARQGGSNNGGGGYGSTEASLA